MIMVVFFIDFFSIGRSFIEEGLGFSRLARV